MLVELRVGGGEKGAQTVFPGSSTKAASLSHGTRTAEPAKIDGDTIGGEGRGCRSGGPPCTALARQGRAARVPLVIGGSFARAGGVRSQARLFVEAVSRAAGDTECAGPCESSRGRGPECSRWQARLWVEGASRRFPSPASLRSQTGLRTGSATRTGAAMGTSRTRPGVAGVDSEPRHRGRRCAPSSPDLLRRQAALRPR